MKTKQHTLLPIIAILVLTIALAACSAGEQAAMEQPTGEPATETTEQLVEENVITETTSPVLSTVEVEGGTSSEASALETVPTGLTQAEVDALIFMREEEKLAYDVYMVLYEHWGLQIFQNIANSEMAHKNSVKALLDAYGLDDPSEGKEIGEFVNEDLQNLYNELVSRGQQSLSDALKVGGAIEEIDIIDLEQHMAVIENPGILMVFENLLKGSRNHLRSFTATLERQTGEVYQPQYLSPEVYESIVTGALETGNGSNGNRP